MTDRQPRDRWLLATGTAGSVLLAVGALGVGALPRASTVQQAWLGVDVLRTSAAGRAVATGLAVSGVLLLLAAWAGLRSAPARTQLAAAALWAAPLLLAPPLASRDVYAYAGQGALLHAGLDPYAVGPQALPGTLADHVTPRYGLAVSPYGPVFLGLAGRVVALTGQHVVPAVLLLRLLAVLGLALLAWALVRLAPAAPGRALWLGVANPLVLVHGVGGAHNEALMAGLLAAGLAVAGTDSAARLALATVLVTCGGLVKLPALAGLAVLAPRRLRPTALVGLVAAATLVVGTLAPGLTGGWLRASTAGVVGPNLMSPVYGAGRLLEALGVQHGLSAAKATGSLLGALAAAALLLAAPRLGALRALGLALLTVATLAPAVQPWYLLWALPPLAAVAGPRLAAALAAGSAVLLLAVLPSGVSLVEGPTWGLPVLLGVLLAALAARSARISGVRQAP